MHSPFEILKKEPAGSFRRFEPVSDLAYANIRIKELTTLSQGEYVVVLRMKPYPQRKSRAIR
jgi:hypothetical protein